MRKTFQFQIKLFSFFAFAFFQTIGSSLLLRAQDTLAHSLLWEISGNGLEKPSYLFGTVHLIPKEKFFYPKGMLTAIEQSEVLFFEIDMEKMNDMGTMLSMMNRILMSDGSSLKDLLSETDYNLVKDHFQQKGLPLMMFERIKPMFLSVLVSPDMNPNSMKDGSMMSYEMELTEIAKKAGKKIEGLETIEFQMSLFDSIPYSDQAIMLVESIKAEGNEKNEYNNIYDAYTEQNLNALNTHIESDASIDMSQLDMLVNNRNINWIPIMQKEMKKQTCFFAVGAGHLAGQKGVLKLLTEEGYLIKPIGK